MASLPRQKPGCQAPVVSPNPPGSSSDEPRIVPDVISEFLPGGGISLLAGAPNMGKTAILSTLVRDIRDCKPVFGHQPMKLPGIGIINADRGWAKGAGLWFSRAGFSDVPHYSLADDPAFNPKKLRHRHERTDLLANFIDRLKLPWGSLIVVDPISLFLGGNLLDYDACMVACHEIRAFLRVRGYTILATAHSSKLKADKRERYMRMQDQILGSTALLGFTDTQMYLAGPQETGKSYYVFLWHPHGAKPETFFLDRDENGLFVDWDGGNTRTQQQVLRLFPDHGVLVNLADLITSAQEIPLSRKTIQRSLDRLMDTGMIEKVGHGVYRKLFDVQ